MIDLFESIIKTHTVVVLSSYVQHNKLSDTAKGLLAQGLRTPSLGTWQLFSRVLFEELQKDDFAFLHDGFEVEFLALDKALNVDKTNIIALRNGYAHGATPSDAQCETDIKKFEPFLNQLLKLQWLNNSALEVREGKVFVSLEKGVLSLHPILLYRKENSDASFAFFNDLKNDKIGLLNYPLGKHYREKDFYKEFHEYLPLNEWKKTGNNEFYLRIEELTETFKGRTSERKKLLNFVIEKNKGYFSIQGNPGIGKSALIAQFFKDLKSHKEINNVQVVEYFIRRGTEQAKIDYLLNYLIKRTDDLFPQGKEIRAEANEIYAFQQQLFSKWRLWGENSKGNKLLFLIDGLDEGVENNVVNYMPRENFENILIIFGSRPGGHKSIDDLWTTLPGAHHTSLELKGLSKEDIRALIYEVANKYEIERESKWIDAVQQRSEGNPLYLKLLCNALENGSIQLNDIHALPKEIDTFYKEILQRYSRDTDGDALLNCLYGFAAAKDYLTESHLGLINKLGIAKSKEVLSTLKEVLFENPLTEDVLDYQLFHESFREYLMNPTAVKEKEIYKINKCLDFTSAEERILDFCATWKDLEGSWEQRYTLEHFALHLSESKREARHTELLNLFKNTLYTTTQKKVLKQFDATKDLYQLSLKIASELQHYEVQLEAALYLVDLKYQEANDAPQVIALVANGEIDLALKRIESFGGTDEDGVKRRFTLYMLCLMELTLLESKNKPFRKTAIEKLLNHLDEQIPPDTSIIDWKYFFPSYTMFLMAYEWAALELDYVIAYKRTDNWDKDWLPEKGPYSDKQFEVLLTCALGISNKSYKSSVLSGISSELAKQGKFEETASAMQEALTCARGISDEKKKSSALLDVSSELAKQGKVEEAASAMQEALTCARGISDERNKSSAFSGISSELTKQGKVEEAASAMQEALTCVKGISDESDKSRALSGISSELAKQGKIEEALTCARGISDERNKSSALLDISSELAKQGKVEKALTCAKGISDEWDKSEALSRIYSELAKQGKVEEALTCAKGISDEWDKSSALLDISSELAKQGKIEEALTCARGMSDLISSALKGISSELAKQGKIEEAASAMQEALTYAMGNSSKDAKRIELSRIYSELAKQGKVEEVASAMQEALTYTRGISDEDEKNSTLKGISSELAKQGKIEEALTCARGISDKSYKSSVLSRISSELAKQGKIEEALTCACADGIIYESDMSSALLVISTELAKQGKVEEAASAMQEALTYSMGKYNEWIKSEALSGISSELAKQGKIEEAASAMQEALTCARGISDEWNKSRALSVISTELTKQGKVEEAASAMQEALTCVKGISNEYKNSTLSGISSELAKQGKVEEALTCVRDMSDESDKSRAFSGISSELAKQGKFEEAASAMQEALTCAKGISDESDKSRALSGISSELAKQGKVEEAASAMQEALTCARGISDKSYKSSVLSRISSELAKQGNWALAETTGLEIPKLAQRHSCWKTIAEISYKIDGWEEALVQVNHLKSDEARLFYLKGLTEVVNEQDVNAVCVQESLSQLANDSESIENLLQKLSVNELFFNNEDKEKINRLNRILNFQWAIDIKAQFPEEDSSKKMSTNIEVWINDITDEDDREQIQLWAKQLAKGKITDENFREKVKGWL
jgi:hypothetical protein